MACLDTDFLVSINRKNPDAIKKLRQMKEENTRLTVTPIAATELLEGAYRTNSEKRIAGTKELIEPLEMLGYDFYAADESGKLLNHLRAIGEKIGEMDTIIGAIALRHGETLLTRNTRHFSKIPGLKVEKW